MSHRNKCPILGVMLRIFHDEAHDDRMIIGLFGRDEVYQEISKVFFTILPLIFIKIKRGRENEWTRQAKYMYVMDSMIWKWYGLGMISWKMIVWMRQCAPSVSDIEDQLVRSRAHN